MFKRLLAVCALLASLTVFFVLPVSASEVSAVDIKYPSWVKFEEICDNVVVADTISGIDYELQNHIFAYSSSSVYSDGYYAGFAKLLCYTFDPNYISDFYYADQFGWSCPAGVSTSKCNILIYYYDFTVDKWVYSNMLDYSDRYWVNAPGPDRYLVSDFDVYLDSSHNTVLYPAGKVQGIIPPSWQSLTWEEMGNAGSDLMSEIVGILPVVLVFIVLSIAIHKGLSFLFDFIRRV